MIEWTEILMRLAIAAFFGAIVGFEREIKDQVAGLRTYMLVSVGAALTMIVSAYGFMEVIQNQNIVLDPSRIAAQVISGIGFIGGGAILFLRPRGIVRGLTTAAGLWAVASIGLAAGAGMYFAASVTTALTIVILFILKFFEKRISIRFGKRRLKITTSGKGKSLQIIDDLFQDSELIISSCTVDKTDEDYIILCSLQKGETQSLKKLIKNAHADNDVKEVVWD